MLVQAAPSADFCHRNANTAVDGFDANPGAGGRQDLLDVTALGITAPNFDANVTILDHGADTLVTISSNTIPLVGVTARERMSSPRTDFLL